MKAVFLQARLSSTRLPRKAMLPLAGKPVIVHVMEALKYVRADAYVLLTDRESVTEFTPITEKCGFDIFVGPKEDVLSRYALAAKKYNPDTVIRATGDNPLVSAALADKITDIHVRASADYSGLIGMPLGTGVEVIKTESLYTADSESTDPYEREHVSPFIYRREQRFLIVRPRVARSFYLPNGSVTLDTQEDYDFLTALYKELYHGDPIEISELVSWLKQNQHSKILHRITM